MTNNSLSPAAQAVLRAYERVRDAALDKDDMRGLAAALRAAADKTCPQSRIKAQNDVRYKLLAIAAELKGSDD